MPLFEFLSKCTRSFFIYVVYTYSYVHVTTTIAAGSGNCLTRSILIGTSVTMKRSI